MNKIVVADKSNIVHHALSMKLISAGYTVRTADSWAELNSYLDDEVVDMVIMDAGFPDWKTMDAIRDLKRNHAELIIIITFKALTIPEVVDFVRSGAEDCIAKPLDMTFLMERIRMLFANRNLDKQVSRKQIVAKIKEGNKETRRTIVPTDEIVHLINLAKDKDVSVLLQGDAGVMKGAYAKYLHELGNRRVYPYITLDCSKSDDLESRLYGHEIVNESGQKTLIPGAMSTAGQGTLVLRDIDCIPMSLQAGLVEALNERRFTPVGGRNVIPFSARVVATTNKDIEQMTMEGTFRQELFYELSVVPIIIPPLSKRRQLFPELTSITLGNLCRRMNLPLPKVSRECLQQIEQYDWPGNEREFIYRMERALIMSDREHFSVMLPYRPNNSSPEEAFEKQGKTFSLPEEEFSLREFMQKKENEVICKVLEKFDGKRNLAAAYMGISERTLRNKLSEMHADGTEI